MDRLKAYAQKVGVKVEQLAYTSKEYIDVAETRIAICKECERYNSKLKLCKECNCFMPAKVLMKEAYCPILKWVSGDG